MEKTYSVEITGELFNYAVDFCFDGNAVCDSSGNMDCDDITCLIDIGIVDSYGVFVKLFEDVSPEMMPRVWPEYIKNQIQIHFNKLFDEYVEYSQISDVEFYSYLEDQND